MIKTVKLFITGPLFCLVDKCFYYKLQYHYFILQFYYQKRIVHYILNLYYI